jgi:site-specific DNA-methyltransferase (adenine-specific)
MKKVYATELGELYQADCLELLRSLKNNSVHTLFADPPST